MPPKKKYNDIKTKSAPPNQEKAIPQEVSFHIYLKRYFHTVAKGNHYVSRIAKDAVERLNTFVNEFIAHTTRSGCKIARDDGRKTLMDRDIDDVFFVLLEPSQYRGSKHRFEEALRDYKEFMDDPYHKRPATLGDKYDLTLLAPTRVLHAMRQAYPEMRISELAVIRLSAFINNMFGIVFRAAMSGNIVRKSDGKKHTRTIGWKPIREVLVDHIHYKISYCRFQL